MSDTAAGRLYRPSIDDNYTPPPAPLGYTPGETLLTLTARPPAAPAAAAQPVLEPVPEPRRQAEPTRTAAAEAVLAQLRQHPKGATAQVLARELNARPNQVGQILAALGRERQVHKTAGRKWLAAPKRATAAGKAPPTEATAMTRTEAILKVLHHATHALSARQIWERLDGLCERGDSPSGGVSVALHDLCKQDRIERCGERGHYQFSLYGRGYTAVVGDATPLAHVILEVLRTSSRNLPISARQVLDLARPQIGAEVDIDVVRNALGVLRKRGQAFSVEGADYTLWTAYRETYEQVVDFKGAAKAKADAAAEHALDQAEQAQPEPRPEPPPVTLAFTCAPDQPEADPLDRALSHQPPVGIADPALEAQRLRKLAENHVAVQEIKTWLHGLAQQIEALSPPA